MKTIGFRDIAGGSIHIYKNVKEPSQKRIDRIKEGLKDLKHTGCIVIYLIKGNKYRRIAVKRS